MARGKWAGLEHQDRAIAITEIYFSKHSSTPGETDRKSITGNPDDTRSLMMDRERIGRDQRLNCVLFPDGLPSGRGDFHLAQSRSMPPGDTYRPRSVFCPHGHSIAISNADGQHLLILHPLSRSRFRDRADPPWKKITPASPQVGDAGV